MKVELALTIWVAILALLTLLVSRLIKNPNPGFCSYCYPV